MTNRNLIRELTCEGYVDMEEGNDVEDSLNVFAVVALFEEVLSRLEALEKRLDSLETGWRRCH